MSAQARGAAGLVVLAALVSTAGCGSSGATSGDAGPGDAACMALENDYMSALGVSATCTPGAADQCAVEIELPTACHCHVFVNMETDTLARAAMALEQSGCPQHCTGSCLMPTSATCVQHIEGSSCASVTN